MANQSDRLGKRGSEVFPKGHLSIQGPKKSGLRATLLGVDANMSESVDLPVGKSTSERPFRKDFGTPFAEPI